MKDICHMNFFWWIKGVLCLPSANICRLKGQREGEHILNNTWINPYFTSAKNRFLRWHVFKSRLPFMIWSEKLWEPLFTKYSDLGFIFLYESSWDYLCVYTIGDNTCYYLKYWLGSRAYQSNIHYLCIAYHYMVK